MTLHNCNHCGQLYLRSKSPYCQGCQMLHDEYYLQIRNYLKSNPKSTIRELHDHTGIPMAKLLEFQKDDYIPFIK